MRLHDVSGSEGKKARMARQLLEKGLPRVPRGRPALPQNKPEAIALKLRHLPDAIQKTVRPAARWLGIHPSALRRVREQVEEILATRPSTKQWSTASPDDHDYLLGRLQTAQGGPIRVAMYALTLSGFADALVELHRRKMEVRVLFDMHWAMSSIPALECLETLLKAGIVPKHFRSVSMHMKLLIIGTIFCSFGSPNLSWSAFHTNIELMMKMVGGCVETMDVCHLFDMLYFVDERAQPADLALVQAQIEKLKEKAKKRNSWARS